MRRILLPLLLGAMITTPALAQDTSVVAEPPTDVAGVDVPGQAEPEPAPDPMICRRVEVTGSRASMQKVCKPRSEWNAQNRRRSGVDSVNQTDCGGASGCEMYPLPST
jgi:hypothetical protein